MKVSLLRQFANIITADSSPEEKLVDDQMRRERESNKNREGDQKKEGTKKLHELQVKKDKLQGEAAAFAKVILGKG